MFNQYFSSKPISRTPSSQSARQPPTIARKLGTRVKTSESQASDIPKPQSEYFKFKLSPFPNQLSPRNLSNESPPKEQQINGNGTGSVSGSSRRMSSNMSGKAEATMACVFEKQKSVGSIQTPRSFKPNLMSKQKKLEEEKEERAEENVYDSFVETRGNLINRIPSMNISHDKFLSRDSTEQTKKEAGNIPKFSEKQLLNHTVNSLAQLESMDKSQQSKIQPMSAQLSRRPSTPLMINMSPVTLKNSIGSSRGSPSPVSDKWEANKKNNISQTSPGSLPGGFQEGWVLQRACSNAKPESPKGGNEASSQDCMWADTELLMNAKFNNTNKCISLMAQNPKPNVGITDNEGWSPLHFAVWHNNLKLLNVLIANSANPNQKTKELLTPLMLAAKMNAEQLLLALLESGADLSAQDSNGNNSLMHAVKGNAFLSVQLLSKHINTDQFSQRNKEAKTALDLCGDQTIKEFLLKLSSQFGASRRITRIQFQEKSGNNDSKISSESKQSKVTGPSNQNFGRGSPRESTGFSVPQSQFGSTGKVSIESFLALKLLGKGSFGEVYLVEKKDTKARYAMKVLDKSKMKSNTGSFSFKLVYCCDFQAAEYNLVNYVLAEKNIMSLNQHPFIVKLHFAFQTERKLFLVMDLCSNGDLSEHIQAEKKFSEEKSRFYLASVLLALENLHKRDIIFRDLKPENVLMDQDGYLMLADFGLSKEGVNDHLVGASSFCGSLAYLSPEMIKKNGHGKAVDWYLLGVLFYEMLTGIPPYFSPEKDQIIDNIMNGPLKVPSKLSPPAKSLLISLLQRNPAKRIGSGKSDAEEIKNHQFFSGFDWESLFKKTMKPPSFLVLHKLNVDYSKSVDLETMKDKELPDKKSKVENWTFINSDEVELSPNNPALIS